MARSRGPDKHGTRGCYVQRKCRCDACKAANRAYWHDRQAKAKAALAAAQPNPLDAEHPLLRKRRLNDGRIVTVRMFRCPGVNGEPCVARPTRYVTKRSHMKVCRICRDRMLHTTSLVPAGRARAHLLELSRQKIGKRTVSAACDVSVPVLTCIRTGRRRRILAETERRILSVDANAAGDFTLVLAGPARHLVARLRSMGQTQRQIATAIGFHPKGLLNMGRCFVRARTLHRLKRFLRALET